ncbi:MAG: cation diffusion facilitator family transporter [bacterium]|nr:cation diffusion facilitator family transporter [bacterium]
MSITKKNVAWMTLAGGLVIFVLKLAAYYLSGSVALLSDALESIVNLLASGLMLYAVYLSEEPADRTHNYGHQKVENISSLIEGILILVAAVMIAEKAVGRLIRPAELTNINVALIISLAATALNGLLSWLLLRTARKFGSLALEGDSKHLLSDVLSSVAVAAGLFLAKLTGWHFLDSALALAVSGLLIKMAMELIKKSSIGLMDQSCPAEESRIIEVLKRHDQLFVDFHDIKTRRSGNRVFAEFHLSVKGDKTVEEAHNLTDHLEEELGQELPEVSLTIHVEPPQQQNQ